MEEVIHGKVKIPKDYFNRAAKREYVFWARSLIREFLQNSVDAGSSSVNFRFNRDRMSLIVQDNGCGMDKDIILNKLLYLGGSHKQDGAIGGFGKAKEILFFAWKSYAIHTKRWFVKGEGSEYSIRKVSSYFNGTRCIIQFYSMTEYNSVLAAAIEYLPRNEVNTNIYLNSSKVNYAFGAKEKLRDLSWGTIYTCSAIYNTISVRINGLEMFKHYASQNLKSQVIVELKGQSVDILTSNRDGLNYKCSNELKASMHDLISNPLSFVINFEKDIKELSGGNKVIIPESLLVMWGNDIEYPDTDGIQGLSTNKSKFKLDFDYEFMIWRSRSYNIEKIEKFMNDPVAGWLAKIWTSLVFEVLLANKMPVRMFRPGFVFHEKASGLCAGNQKFPTILFNPLSTRVITSKDIKELKEVLEDIAYHETSHIFNRKHDESFVLTSERCRSEHRKWKGQSFSVKVLNWRKIIGGKDGHGFDGAE